MQQNQIGDRGGNTVESKAGLRQAQVAGHYNEFQIQNNVFFTIDGVFGGLAPADNVNACIAAFTYSLPSVTNVPACNSALFALWVNNTNAVSVTKGANVDATKLSGTTGRTGERVLPFPDIEAGKALFGLIRVTVGTGASFTFGTTNFNATNINTAFLDTAQMPTVPLTS